MTPKKGADPRAVFGAESEDRVCRLLEKRGFEILARNVRLAGGEIDLIARRTGELHFVEVRARRSAMFLNPAESVDERKRQRIRKAAEAWLSRNQARLELQTFLDVAAVVGDQIELIVGAFE